MIQCTYSYTVMYVKSSSTGESLACVRLSWVESKQSFVCSLDLYFLPPSPAFLCAYLRGSLNAIYTSRRS